MQAGYGSPGAEICRKKDADRANQIYWTWNGFQGDSDWASFEALFGGSE